MRRTRGHRIQMTHRLSLPVRQIRQIRQIRPQISPLHQIPRLLCPVWSLGWLRPWLLGLTPQTVRWLLLLPSMLPASLWPSEPSRRYQQTDWKPLGLAQSQRQRPASRSPFFLQLESRCSLG